MPCFNSWEPKTQQIWAGVPNGLRNSVLYLLDQKSNKYKKYRIPSHNNPYYTREDDIQNIKEYGGEQDDRYQQLVVGQHGSASFQVIPRETIQTRAFPFERCVYTSAHKIKGIRFDEVLRRPKLPEDMEYSVLAIDPGFVDPTIMQIIGKNKKGEWFTYLRYKLQRIDFNEQEIIIDWLASYYNINLIALDIGAGGNGAAMMHNLVHRDEYKAKDYVRRITGIQFAEKIVAGFNDLGEELVQEAKIYAGNELAKIIQEGKLIFSEIDQEGISQMERVAKQKGLGGKDRFFIINEKGAGADDDDHIFASYICFVLAIKDKILFEVRTKLSKPKLSYT